MVSGDVMANKEWDGSLSSVQLHASFESLQLNQLSSSMLCADLLDLHLSFLDRIPLFHRTLEMWTQPTYRIINWFCSFSSFSPPHSQFIKQGRCKNSPS